MGKIYTIQNIYIFSLIIIEEHINILFWFFGIFLFDFDKLLIYFFWKNEKLQK